MRHKTAWTKSWIGMVSVAMLTAGVTAGTASADDEYGYDRVERRTTLADSPIGAAAFVATVGAGLLLASHFDGDNRRVRHRHHRHGHYYKKHHRRLKRHQYRNHRRFGHGDRYDRGGHRYSRHRGHAAHVWRAPRHKDRHGRYDHDLSNRRHRRGNDDRIDRRDRRERRDRNDDDRRRQRRNDRW